MGRPRGAVGRSLDPLAEWCWVAEEPLQAATSVSPSQALQVRTGFLPPAIASPADGLIVNQTDSPAGVYVHSGGRAC